MSKKRQNKKQIKKDTDLKIRISNSPYPTNSKLLQENTVIKFDDGIPAFEDSKRFILLFNDKIKPFCYLKSLDIESLGFVCIDPFLIYNDYCVNVPAKYVSLLSLNDPEKAFLLSFTTVNEDPKKITANLMAPIIVNCDNLFAAQIILENYPVQYKVWDAIEKMQITIP